MMQYTISLLLIITTIGIGRNTHGLTSKTDVEVAKTIAMEACGEGYEGMYRVANVINNRSEQWYKTPFEIVSQKNQFVGYTHPNRDRRFKECEKESLYLAKNLRTLGDKTNGALFFKRSEEKRQKWHDQLTVIWGNHEFWK